MSTNDCALVVEDDPCVCERIAKNLLEWFPDFNVLHADTGEEALKHARKRALKLVTVDSVIGGHPSRGPELVRELRRILPHAVIIMVVSPLPWDDFVKKGREAGADDGLTKGANMIENLAIALVRAKLLLSVPETVQR